MDPGSAEYGPRRDAISGNANIGLSAHSEGLGAVRLGVPRIINRHEARLNRHSGIPTTTIRGEGLESPREVVLRRQQLQDSGHCFGHYSHHNELLRLISGQWEDAIDEGET